MIFGLSTVSDKKKPFKSKLKRAKTLADGSVHSSRINHVLAKAQQEFSIQYSLSVQKKDQYFHSAVLFRDENGVQYFYDTA